MAGTGNKLQLDSRSNEPCIQLDNNQYGKGKKIVHKFLENTGEHNQV
jgi:hypothetical protein